LFYSLQYQFLNQTTYKKNKNINVDSFFQQIKHIHIINKNMQLELIKKERAQLIEKNNILNKKGHANKCFKLIV